MEKRKFLKGSRGITLIALVLTIIILIILAGVSITLIGGPEGIISKAQEAKEKTRASQIKEAVDLASITNALETEENKVTKASIIEELKAKGQLTDEEETALEDSDTITIGDITIDFSILEGNGTPKQTLASQITAANYGDKVNYSVTVNGVTLDNWKIFYKDETTNEVILKYGDYLPNSTNLAASAELLQGTGDTATYGVYSNTDRADLINKLNDTSKWSSLIRSDLAGKATAKGAVDLETWVASWNAKEYTRLYIAKKTGMSDGLDGYYIGTSENPTSYSQDVSSDAGYNNTLYFPHQEKVSDCYGYWLASPSAYNSGNVMYVNFNGRVGTSSYDNSDLGACPAVYLTSDVYTSGKDASGAWVIE